MGPLTKRRHSTHRSGNRQAGQPGLKLVRGTSKRYMSSRARKSARGTSGRTTK